MHKQTDTTPAPIALENMLMEILEYAALLNDLTVRSVSSGMDFTAHVDHSLMLAYKNL